MSVRDFKAWTAAHPWMRVAGSVLLLAAALLMLPRHRLAAAVRHLDAGTLGFALPLYLAIHVLASLKWRLVVNRAGAGIGLAASMECYFAGIFGTLFLPSLVGGDAVTVTLAMTRAERPAGVVSGAFLSRALDTLALTVLVGLTSLAVPAALVGESARLIHLLGWVGGGLLGAGGLLILVLRPAWRPARVDRFVCKHREAFEPLRRPSLIALPLGASFALQIAFAMLAYWIARATALHVSPVTWIFGWSLAKLVAFLPLTIAGIGARELALAALLAPFGVPAAETVTVGLLWDVVVVAGSLASGVTWKALGWRALKRPGPPRNPRPTPTGS